MLSASERDSLKTEDALVVGRKFLVSQGGGFVFIAPFVDEKADMPHKFKEECRVLKIEPKLRPYLYKNSDAFFKVKELLTAV